MMWVWIWVWVSFLLPHITPTHTHTHPHPHPPTPTPTHTHTHPHPHPHPHPFIDEIKKKSYDKDYAVITSDFAVNYTLVAQREVQSAHWNQEQVAIFTIHNLSCHREEFGIEAEWLFTATAHGKSAYDG
ncbi:hypothetical protein I4U23_010804 [Adineta vaga]|nr:hypothetical protein I4U23_010804 [Adineta vaga]